MSDVFSTMPEVPEKSIEDVKNSFANYLFYTYLKPGVRQYTCTACGKTFKRGVNVQLRTSTPNDRLLEKAKNDELLECPCCGKSLRVRKLTNKATYDTWFSKKIVFVLPANDKKVWFRGYLVTRRFTGKANKIFAFTEYDRYMLVPGAAIQWNYNWYHKAFLESSPNITEPFWNGEHYDLRLPKGVSLENTFLKNNGYKSAILNCGYLPPVKYLCLFAEYPQFEMLVKTGHMDVISDLVVNNAKNTRILDWNAKKIWDFFKLTHQEYNEYVKRGSKLDLLKTFKRIKGKGFKDFEKAEKVYSFFSHRYNMHGEIIKLQSMAKCEGKSAYDAVKYFEKIAKKSIGGCHVCPGITSREAYNLWVDYIEMLKAKNSKLDNVQLFPHDLKARHDELLKEKNRKLAKDRAKQEKKHIKDLVKKYKKFDKVNEICEEIKDKYAYSNAGFSIIVPQTIEEIIKESVALNMCIHRVENGRYFDRIQRRETYLFFLRENKHKNDPWYIIEAEPDGTVQQKRTENDSQYEDDIKAFTPFLREWQAYVQTQLTESDYKLSQISKKLRKENFDELRKTKKQVNYGNHRGELLIDLLEKDLLEVIAS